MALPNCAPKRQTSSELQDDILIAVMGCTGSGKSSFIKLLTGDTSIKIGGDLESETDEIKEYRFVDELSGRNVSIVDTPGFDDSRQGVTDTDILRNITHFLLQAYDKGRKLNGLIYLYRISDPRFTGQSARNLKMFKELCGKKTFENIVILTTYWDRIPVVEEGVKREDQLKTKFCKALADGGAVFMRHDRTLESVRRVLGHIDVLTPKNVRITEEIRLENMKLEDTGAGSVHREEVERMIAKYNKEVADLKAEVDGMVGWDETLRSELEEERAVVNQKLARWESEMLELKKGLEEECVSNSRERLGVDAGMKESLRKLQAGFGPEQKLMRWESEGSALGKGLEGGRVSNPLEWLEADAAVEESLQNLQAGLDRQKKALEDLQKKIKTEVDGIKERDEIYRHEQEDERAMVRERLACRESEILGLRKGLEEERGCTSRERSEADAVMAEALRNLRAEVQEGQKALEDAQKETKAEVAGMRERDETLQCKLEEERATEKEKFLWWESERLALQKSLEEEKASNSTRWLEADAATKESLQNLRAELHRERDALEDIQQKAKVEVEGMKQRDKTLRRELEEERAVVKEIFARWESERLALQKDLDEEKDRNSLERSEADAATKESLRNLRAELHQEQKALEAAQKKAKAEVDGMKNRDGTLRCELEEERAVVKAQLARWEGETSALRKNLEEERACNSRERLKAYASMEEALGRAKNELKQKSFMQTVWSWLEVFIYLLYFSQVLRVLM